MFASPIDVTTIRRLAEFPRIIGIKDSSGDIAHMLRMMAAVQPSRPDFTFLTGWEPAMVPMLAMGCQGGTFAMGGVVPEFTRKIFDLMIAGRIPEARTLQMGLTELFDLVVGADFPEGVRAAVELRGFKLGVSRQPVDDNRRLDRSKLASTIQGLL